MSTLIIHPKDTTTTFLEPIYASIKEKTLVTGGTTKNELRKLIKNHKRIIMLGHGTPMGLLSIGQFNDDFYVIDDSFADLLSEKENNICIWCHASEFMSFNKLCGFGSGMFISEIEEAIYCNICGIHQNLVDESNNCFASIMSKFINHPLDVLYENVIQAYGKLADTNPIVVYNLSRLFLNMNEHHSVSSTLRF